jgi:poly(hydroxyalkanoate) depolymerase family esterase
VPVGQDREEPLPLLCMLHGCTQDPASFAAATRMNDAAERHGFVVVYPEQQRGANPQGCWNWFLPEHQHRGAGEPAALAGIVEQVIAASDQAIDARRVFVAGLSSGGAMAAIFAATYPDVVAAAAVHSGLAYGSASNVSAAFQTMARGGATAAEQGPAARRAMGPHARAVPTMVIHGRADQTVAPVNADQVLQQAMTANRLATAGAWDIDPGRPTTTAREHRDGGLAWTRSRWTDGAGRLLHELILVDGLGHAWSGGPAGGSYTDPRGPDATEAILRFFAAATSATAR